METREVRHVGVFSVAKLSAAISLVMSFITAILSLALVYFGVTITENLLPPVTLSAGVAAVLIGIAVVTVVGMIIGFISGMIVAVIYNFAAGISGGIEIDLD